MLSGLMSGSQNPYWAYSPLTGGVYIAPPPPAPSPACWKEPYVVVPTPQTGSDFYYYVPNLTDYASGCDALLQDNGVFMHPDNFQFVPNDIDYNFALLAWVDAGNWVSFEPITNANQKFWLREFYWTVLEGGTGLTSTDIAWNPWRGARDNTNSNIAHNGVLVTPGQDFVFDQTTNTFTFNFKIENDDIIGILPTCAVRNNTFSGVGSPLIPLRLFTTTKTGTRQQFTDPLLSGYLSAGDMIVCRDGVVLQPEIDYSWDRTTLTIFPYTRVGTQIIVLANSKNCPVDPHAPIGIEDLTAILITQKTNIIEEIVTNQ